MGNVRSELEREAMLRADALSALARQRVEPLPEELRSALQGLNTTVRRYVSQHRTFSHQESQTWLALLAFEDSLLALSLADETSPIIQARSTASADKEAE